MRVTGRKAILSIYPAGKLSVSKRKPSLEALLRAGRLALFFLASLIYSCALFPARAPEFARRLTGPPLSPTAEPHIALQEARLRLEKLDGSRIALGGYTIPVLQEKPGTGSVEKRISRICWFWIVCGTNDPAEPEIIVRAIEIRIFSVLFGFYLKREIILHGENMDPRIMEEENQYKTAPERPEKEFMGPPAGSVRGREGQPYLQPE